MSESFFDDLARTLARPMPRRRAVRLMGAALVTAALPGPARAALAGRVSSSCEPGTFECKCPNQGLFFRACCPTKIPGKEYTCECFPDRAQCTPRNACPPGSTRCGNKCCDAETERCVSAKLSLCCPNEGGWNSCTSADGKSAGRCCPPGTKCCFTDTKASCCGADQTCRDGECRCKPGEGTQCGAGCCKKGETCCDPVRGTCCKKGTTCCREGERRSSCCEPGQSCCGGTCCNKGQVCFYRDPNYDPSGTGLGQLIPRPDLPFCGKKCAQPCGKRNCCGKGYVCKQGKCVHLDFGGRP